MSQFNEIFFDLIGPGAPGGTYNFGLGNLLFQVAAGLSLAKDNDAQVYFEQLRYPNYGQYHNSIFHKVNTDYNGNKQLIGMYTEPSFDYNPLPFANGAVYKGYFQSEKYFAHNRDLILDMIQLPYAMGQEIENENQEIVSLENKTAIHVRRGDYVKLSHAHPVLSTEYYKKAIDIIGSDTNYVVFSDDIAWCKQDEFFASLPNVIFSSGRSEIEDLYLMSICNNNIIANSTFSWWGAWLNKNNDKTVIGPVTWFGPAKTVNTNDIVPESWRKI